MIGVRYTEWRDAFSTSCRGVTATQAIDVFIGIEVGPLRWFVADAKKIFSSRKNLSALYRDMWHYPLTDIDIVYTFLSPTALPRIWQKVSAELRPSSTFMTLVFPVPTQSDKTIAVKDETASELYIHRIGR